MLTCRDIIGIDQTLGPDVPTNYSSQQGEFGEDGLICIRQGLFSLTELVLR